MNPTSIPSSSQLESLALHLATKHMQDSGSIPPTVLIATPTGIYEFRSQALANVAAKEKMVQTVRLLAVANRAVAVTVLLECWARLASTPGGTLGDRQEAVMIATECRTEPRVELLRIERHPNGRFREFSKIETPGLTNVAGRFAGLLPPKEPSDQEVQQAKVLLGMSGIQADGTLLPSHLN